MPKNVQSDKKTLSPINKTTILFPMKQTHICTQYLKMRQLRPKFYNVWNLKWKRSLENDCRKQCIQVDIHNSQVFTSQNNGNAFKSTTTKVQSMIQTVLSKYLNKIEILFNPYINLEELWINPQNVLNYQFLWFKCIRINHVFLTLWKVLLKMTSLN